MKYNKIEFYMVHSLWWSKQWPHAAVHSRGQRLTQGPVALDGGANGGELLPVWGHSGGGPVGGDGRALCRVVSVTDWSNYFQELK